MKLRCFLFFSTKTFLVLKKHRNTQTKQFRPKWVVVPKPIAVTLNQRKMGKLIHSTQEIEIFRCFVSLGIEKLSVLRVSRLRPTYQRRLETSQLLLTSRRRRRHQRQQQEQKIIRARFHVPSFSKHLCLLNFYFAADSSQHRSLSLPLSLSLSQPPLTLSHSISLSFSVQVALTV